jgi:hypothetical protein
MIKKNLRGQGRIAGSLAVTMALFGGAAAVTSGPAQAAPVEDCATAATIADLAAGDDVTGLTVSSGTTPEGFTGEILGVYEDGIAPGIDMVMAELTSPAIDDAGGIWQGMSGSPVYDTAGDLVGAVAYGLAWGTTPVAGITPYEKMDDYLPGTSPRVKVPSRIARTIAARTDVTREQAARGFSELKMPLGVSGVRDSRLAASFKAQKQRKVRYLSRDTYRMSASAAADAAPSPDTIVAGGNMAAAMSYGDITQGGVGTATSVCDGHAVGFGHPATFAGRTTMTLHPADALYIQEDPLGVPFKVANLGAPAGTVTDDHLTGITGSFGATPDATDITSTVSYATRERTGASHVSVPDANASTTFYQQLANHDVVLDGIVKGSELLTWSVSGDDNGTPFTIASTDRYASQYDIAFEAPWEVSDIVWFLSSINGVTIDEVVIDGAVNDDWSTWHVKAVEQKRKGQWVKVGKGSPVLARAGKPLKVRAVLKNGTGSTTVPLVFAVPAKAAGSMGGLEVTGGAWTWTDGEVDSVDDVEKLVAGTVRNDAVEGRLMLEGRRKGIERRDVSPATERVVEGQKRVRVLVR